MKENNMWLKVSIGPCCAALAFAALIAQASAQIRLDMNRITCKNWLSYSSGDQEFVRDWMSGYYNAAANSNVLDYDRLQRNSAAVKKYCKGHMSATLPTAIKAAAK
jgi:acid stress chaperone HdeB